MKWGHVCDMIAGQLEKIDRIGYDIFPPSRARSEFEQMLRREYNACSKEMLDAVEFLIRTGHWPEMTATVKFFMRARLLFAWKVTASLSTPLVG